MITNFLLRNGINILLIEGYCEELPAQVKDLRTLISTPNVKILEIGFNAGHSAEVFLMTNKTCSVVSFDLGEKEYTNLSKSYIDKVYPNRHTLILGDSRVTLPEFIKQNPLKKFDIFFIDGGHSYEVAKSDTECSYKLSKPNSLVIIDDIVGIPEYIEGYNEGPIQVWNEFVEDKRITPIDKRTYCKGRGMAWGYFNL